MIFKSPYPDIAIPEVPLASFILERAPQFSAKPALIDGATGRTLTYGELTKVVNRVAASLAARGFRKGDVCAIHCLNCPDQIPKNATGKILRRELVLSVRQRVRQ